MSQIDQFIGQDYTEKLGRVLHEEGLLLPNVDVDYFINDSRLNLENWLNNPDEYITSGGVWLQKYSNSEAPDEKSSDVWQIHFTPPYIVKELVDGNPVMVETNLVESSEDLKYSTMLAGIMGMSEYIAFVEAGYLPKPAVLFGITNKTMAKFACKRLGFELNKEIDNDSDAILATYENVKFATKDLIRKFGSKILKLGLKELKDFDL